MESENADRLIERFWEIQKQLRTIQTALSRVEYMIADEVPDDP